MLARRALLTAAFVLVLVARSGVSAAAQPFDVTAFAEAQRQGRLVLVAVDARWCPVCLVQRTILWALMRQDRYKPIAPLVVDFEEQKSIVRYFGAQSQSTLIVFRGGAERGRSVGETNDRSIAALLDRIL